MPEPTPVTSHLTEPADIVPRKEDLARLADEIEQRYRNGLRDGRRENRKFKRYQLSTPVRIALASIRGEERGDEITGQSVNLSLLGIGVAVDEPLDLGVMVTVAFDMPAHPPRSVKMLAQVRNLVPAPSGRYVVGIEFHQTLAAASTGA